MYYLEKNGQRQGPFDTQTLKTMANEGKISPDTILYTDTNITFRADDIIHFNTDTIDLSDDPDIYKPIEKNTLDLTGDDDLYKPMPPKKSVSQNNPNNYSDQTFSHSSSVGSTYTPSNNRTNNNQTGQYSNQYNPNNETFRNNTYVYEDDNSPYENYTQNHNYGNQNNFYTEGNNSGSFNGDYMGAIQGGIDRDIPHEITGLNWGAFWLTIFWAITHHVWIGLLIFIPGIDFLVRIYLLLKGNAWGWKCRRFSSAHDFIKCQNIWGKWGWFTIALSIAYYIIFFILIITIFSAGTCPYR